MSFATALSCIDGRIQEPVSDFLLTRFGVTHLDTVTRAGIVKHLTASYDPATASIVEDLEASLKAHGSQSLALVAHDDCAGNPLDESTQRAQLVEAVAHFGRRYPDIDVIGLWLGDGWSVDVIG